MCSRLIFLLVVFAPVTANAFNALGHRVVAEIAWQQLSPERRQEIVDTLKRHPRFGEDFIQEMPKDVAEADQVTQGRWIFWQAAVWPDVARGGPYDRPTWHYINRPTFLDGQQVPVGAQLSTEYPSDTPMDELNCIQATKHALSVLKDDEAGPDAKAIAYCWLFHLVGDMHQPMHSTALFCEYFPDGCKGGNEISLSRGRNLHSLWDNLLGRDDRPANVRREAGMVTRLNKIWAVDPTAVPEEWIGESHELARRFAYDPAILAAVRVAKAGEPMEPVSLSEDYLRTAGAKARARVFAAGLRLGFQLRD